ncbi:MAG: hypothetical protein JSU96_07750, partial [Acidobacteriota bacterium]
MKRFSLCVIVLLTLTALSLFAGKPEKPGKPGGGGTDPEEPPVIDYSQGFEFSDVNLIIGEAERVTILSGKVDEPLAWKWSQDTQDNASTRSVITANLDGVGSPEIVVSRYCGAGKVKGQAYYKLFINVFHEDDLSYTRSVDSDNTYGLFATTYNSNPIIDVMSYPAKVAAGDL